VDFESNWTGSARRDLKSIIDYLGRFNPDAVDYVVGAVVERADALTSAPYVGDIWERCGRRETRVIVQGSYRIFFEVDPDESLVTIRKILHVRQQDPDFSE
jgi:plasmid stabilization system protein ParE